MKVAAVILAAGLSSRMGEFKPLLPLGGKSLLAHCAALFSASGLGQVVAVVGHRAEETAVAAESLGLRWVANPDFRSGMFSSVQCGVAALPGDIEAFFVLPVDIPLVRIATLQALLAAARESDTVISPVFNGRRGHPPLIPAALIPEILANEGRGGLKDLLGRHKWLEVAVWDEGILLDADTPEDLLALQRRQARLSVPTPAEAESLAAILLPEPGLAHGRLVARAAVALAGALAARGYLLDLDLLYAAALLHDVAKGQPRHEIRGAEMLSGLGLKETAAIVAAHKDTQPPATGRLGEKELVCLADKLIAGTRRLPIEGRYAEKLAAFAGDAEACRAIVGRRDRALALKSLAEQAAGRDLETILTEAGL